ncbi:MAG: NADH-quinone oxidoreductase subunit N [Planctomycetes bacterium]|nr:NADH-quinone oxidoreductase subunit N [Planctomycetota bacterium]
MNDLQNALLAGQFRYILPEIVLAVAATGIFIGGTFRSGRYLWSWAALGSLVASLFVLTITAGFVLPSGEAGRTATFSTPLLFDSLANFVRVLAIVAGILLVLFSWNEVPDRHAADYLACLLVIIGGVGLTACANDLVSLYLALELISIPTYILLYLPRHDDAAQEAALKYFLLSIFSSALLLFGFSYLYGLTGTTNIAAILHTLYGQGGGDMPAVAQIALITVVAGLGFRITAAPFHFYAPDVYQGAPTVGAALLASLPKLAGFIALLRVLGFVTPDGVLVPVAGRPHVLPGMALSDQVPILFWFLAAFTMSLGNLLAVLQDNLKRLLAYSSVAHAGYMLVALAAAPYLSERSSGSDGVHALLYYLVAYGVMTIGAFAVIAFLSTPERPVDNVEDLAGLSGSHPYVALMLAVFMFSLIGMPLTAGFTGKFLIFFGAMNVVGEQADLYRWLAVIGMLNAAVGGWYYLRIIAVMYLRTALRPIQGRRNVPGLVTLIVCAVLTIGLSIPPGANVLLDAVKNATGIKSTPSPIAQR